MKNRRVYLLINKLNPLLLQALKIQKNNSYYNTIIPHQNNSNLMPKLLIMN